METRGAAGTISRRAMLRVAGFLGVSGAVTFLVGGPGRVRAQGNPEMLQRDEKVEATLKRLFGSRPLKNGSAAIKIDLPPIAENGGQVPITVEVQSRMIPTDYVKSIYIISDKNPRPLIAKFTLTPDLGAAVIGVTIRLAETTDVRAIAELNVGILLMVKRAVKVVIGGCEG